MDMGRHAQLAVSLSSTLAGIDGTRLLFWGKWTVPPLFVRRLQSCSAPAGVTSTHAICAAHPFAYLAARMPRPIHPSIHRARACAWHVSEPFLVSTAARGAIRPCGSTHVRLCSRCLLSLLCLSMAWTYPAWLPRALARVPHGCMSTPSPSYPRHAPRSGRGQSTFPSLCDLQPASPSGSVM